MADHDEDDGLTAEERAALAEDDALEEGQEDEQEEGEAAEQDEAADPPAPEGEQDGEQDGEQEASKEDGQEDPQDEVVQPIFVAEAPEDANTRLDQIKAEKDGLVAQYEDGDITAKEYQQKLDELYKQERDIEFQIQEARLAEKMREQQLRNEWAATVNGFIEANPIYKENERLYKMLDQEVKDVALSEEGKTMTGAQVLARAHKNLSEAFGLTKTDVRTKRRTDAPPSLHDVPAADANDVSGGKYAALDRLASTSPIAYEEALMKMSDAERDAYLASQ